MQCVCVTQELCSPCMLASTPARQECTAFSDAKFTSAWLRLCRLPPACLSAVAQCLPAALQVLHHCLPT